MGLELTPEEVARRMEAGEVELVDVRRDDEVAEGRIPGARHIGMERLAEAAARLDRERALVFYCHVGERSLMAAQAFDASGFEAASMAGGIAAWEAAGLPVER